MASINLDDALRKLATLIARARSGEEIVIADHAGNAVRLAPIQEQPVERLSYRGNGLLKGKVRVSDEDLFRRLPDDEAARLCGFETVKLLLDTHALVWRISR